LEQIGIGKDFLNRAQIVQQLRDSYWQMGLHGTKKLLHNRRNGHLSKEAARRMGENLGQLHFWQEINN
jgi:hypothetical protein